MRTIVLGGRRYGKTTTAMSMAMKYQNIYEGTKVTVLHPSRTLAVNQSKKFPQFQHYGIENYLRTHIGMDLEAKSLYVIEEISYIPENWLDTVESITPFFETIYTVTPRLYNRANPPKWVKIYHTCDNQVILDEPELFEDWVDELRKVVSVHQEVAHYNILPAYKITDVELPEELEHLKEDIIEELNRNAPNY